MKSAAMRAGAAALVCAAAFPVLAAQSQSTYPDKPIRLIALSSAGSGPDIVGRLIGAKLTEAWGQQVIVDPRPGASGIVGSEIAARAAPDGHTLVIITSQAVIVSQMYDNLKYDLAKDFAPITMIGSTPFILAVHPGVQAQSVKEMIALVKAKPRQFRYGSGGSGSPPHLSFEILKSMSGMDVQHVPYKGITPAMTDTIAGQVHMLISVIPAVLPTVRAGRLRALGVTSAQRSPLVPDIPAIAETVPGYEFIGWYSVCAPAKAPSGIVNKLNAELLKIVGSPEMRERFSDIGIDVTTSTPKELATYIAAQMKKMREAIAISGARADR
ncbi:MAG TPA: tripartite tricarboxylate transporter substrate binding protein [Burkholderiales bacterium]|nr:tripartite tricarboxylate transporter substrate binding protein [Burkholderiales bacterium]